MRFEKKARKIRKIMSSTDEIPCDPCPERGGTSETRSDFVRDSEIEHSHTMKIFEASIVFELMRGRWDHEDRSIDGYVPFSFLYKKAHNSTSMLWLRLVILRLIVF